jgi:S-DNA-T family DNA segregation ATPase FtsK/SpoIIIE
VAGIVLLGLSLFVGLSVGSLQLGTGTLMGPCGATVGVGVYALIGIGAYLAAACLAVAALRCLAGRPLALRSIESAALVTAAIFGAVLLHLAAGSHRLRGFGPGGLIGEYGAELLVSLMGRVGAVLVDVTGLAVSLVLSTPLSIRAIGGWIGRHTWAALGLAGRGVAAVFPESTNSDRARDATPTPTRIAGVPRRTDDTLSEKVIEVGENDVSDSQPSLNRRRKKRDEAAAPARTPDIAAPAVSAGVPGEIIDDKTEASVLPPIMEEDEGPPKPMIVEPLALKKKELAAPPAPKPDYIPAEGGYHLPELALLDYQDPGEDELDKSGMLALADRLQKTLADYGVKGSVVQIHPGPVVTMYEFVPAPGTKLSKITALSNDLAMSLQALRVRIVAPIPGKGSVGIEVPNKKRATVYLKEILVDENVQKAKSKLTLGLGKDISGSAVAVDLAKMPHLLVAGTTGSGKSVAVNGMICSVLFNANPEEVRMIMIDPKMVELSIYEGIPHLLLPVVTDPKKANLALRWAVDEMERRYELVSKAGVRDILAYNKRVEKQIADGPKKPESKKIKIFVEEDGGDRREVEVSPSEAAVEAAGGVITQDVREEISAAHAAMQAAAVVEPPPRKLPYIVIIIDEFADLMMVAPKDVETSVARIAQKARAVGIHLVLATQRPSVDVITGLIKANFPSRIAFQVASKIDSRTILDQQGAENLLGMGDMLFTDRGQALRRVHGALVTDVEIKQLVDFLKKQGQPVYDMDILKPREDEEGEAMGGPSAEEGDDPLYDQAVRLVCETRMASVSMIQRRLQIGFNRAARLVERMERDGIVGAPNGSKPREVLAQAI